MKIIKLVYIYLLFFICSWFKNIKNHSGIILQFYTMSMCCFDTYRMELKNLCKSKGLQMAIFTPQ